MGVDTKHPDYIDRVDEWRLMRDAAQGETAIKKAKETYLPKPSGFKVHPDGGAGLYEVYMRRAQFPDITTPTIGGMVGVIHGTETKIEMPESMQHLWECATADGMSLEAFHRRVTTELLTTGRFGILVDAPTDGAELPHMVCYSAERIINWSADHDFYVLDESGLVRNGFEWQQEAKYLALELVDGHYTATTYKGENLEGGEEVTPQGRGAKALTEIPFVIIGARDLSVTPEVPPLLGVARSSVSQYQLSADYRWQLFMTGQETLFIINGKAPEAVGAGVVISLNGDGAEKQPDAKYVGPNGTGIAAHKTAIDDEKQVAISAGARLFSDESRAQESGDALRIRYTAQTASLMSIAMASAAGLEKALRYIAVMIGANPEEVIVKPPKHLVDQTLSPEQINTLVKAWQDGAISYQTMYENLQAGQVTSPERDFEEELELIDNFRDNQEYQTVIVPDKPNDETAA